MKKLLLVLLFVPLVSFGQTKDEIELCLAIQGDSFISDFEAENALDRILNVIGASKNFVLTPCDKINNAIATSYKGVRYILYDKAFMRAINSRTNDWSSLTILAHEVGHHINGHALDLTMYMRGDIEAKTLAKKRKQELEADEFAGFIMAKLGAPLSQVKAAIALISSDKDDTYSTHPKKSKRLASVLAGYNKGYESKIVSNPKKINNKKSPTTLREEKSYYWTKLENDDPFRGEIAQTYGKIKGDTFFKSGVNYINDDGKPRISIEEIGGKTTLTISGLNININPPKKNFDFSLLLQNNLDYARFNNENNSDFAKRTRFNNLKYYSGVSVEIEIVFDDKTILEFKKDGCLFSWHNSGPIAKYNSLGIISEISTTKSNCDGTSSNICDDLGYPLGADFCDMKFLVKKIKENKKMYIRFKDIHIDKHTLAVPRTNSSPGKVATFGKYITNTNFKGYLEFSLSGSSRALKFYDTWWQGQTR